ncbi:MAG: hypothetical protein ACKO2G_16875 [Verrucomicrobiales bacterium]
MFTNSRVLFGLIFAVFAGVSPVVAQTADKAVGVLQTQYGIAYGSRMVAITGVDGQHQPKEWHLFAFDLKEPNLISHFVVKGGKITMAVKLDPQRSKVWAAPVLSWNAVKISSETAFKTADTSARAAMVGFDSLDYRLMNDRTTSLPVYQLELKDAGKRVVGNLKIDAINGRLVSQNWPGKPGAGGMNRQDRLDWQIVKEQMGKVGRDIGTVFRDLGANVRRRFQR